MGLHFLLRVLVNAFQLDGPATDHRVEALLDAFELILHLEDLLLKTHEVRLHILQLGSVVRLEREGCFRLRRFCIAYLCVFGIEKATREDLACILTVDALAVVESLVLSLFDGGVRLVIV
jgi:hypothetical protein